MEQTNLVVTPDGKTWDEVTRDVSYLGGACVFASNDDSGWTQDTHYRFWRGLITNTRNYAFNKNFAIGYDRIICLKTGQYKINYNSQNHMGSPSGNGNLKFNGTIVAIIRNTADASSNSHYSGEASVIINLVRGDYVHTDGVRHMASGYGHFEIFKI